jgi:hypothetical protein
VADDWCWFFWERNIAGWLLVAAVGWWLISQTNKDFSLSRPGRILMRRDGTIQVIDLMQSKKSSENNRLEV